MIQIKDLTKRYGQHLAVDHLNFSVDKGEILGFLGPNGAGKSTTMNIITGYLSATEGSVTIDGLDLIDHPMEVKRKIGYLPEFPPLYPEMTVSEYLNFVAEIKKVTPAEKKESLEKIMDLVKIGDVRGRLIKNLSKGYKQRVGLAQALVGNPTILILDEPTVGLDPRQIMEMRTLIKELGKEHTVVLSSHILPEVSAVCERVIIINKGKIVASDSPENLSKRLTGGSHLLLRVAGPETEVVSKLTKVAGVSSVRVKGEREPGTVDVVVEADAEEDIRRSLFFALSEAQLPILLMKAEDLTLEEIFLQLITEEEVAS
ncbi:MAG: ATP-binding cassette domain-containing protein [Firmicutes bacterium]|nr:ATP-binding cassette domain-containing protein [Bacillota bacterium]